MPRLSLMSCATGALLCVIPLSLVAENLISPDRTWGDAEGCNVLAGNWSGQAFTILTREEIRFWETTCTIVDTRHSGGQTLVIEASCEGLEDTRQEEFQMGARIGGPVRLFHEASNWEVFLNEC